LAGINNQEYTLELKARKIFKYASLTVLGLCLVHLVARVVAGFTTLNYVYSPSESESSIFWKGFWQFYYTNDRFTPAMNTIEPVDVIAPHLGVVLTLALVIGVVFAIRYLGRATSEQISKISIAISITAISISGMTAFMRAMMT